MVWLAVRVRFGASGGSCTMTPATPDGATFPGHKDDVTNDPFEQRFKEPELIPALIEELAGSDASPPGVCTIRLFLVTDGNNGHVLTDDGTKQGVAQCPRYSSGSNCGYCPN